MVFYQGKLDTSLVDSGLVHQGLAVDLELFRLVAHTTSDLAELEIPSSAGSRRHTDVHNLRNDGCTARTFPVLLSTSPIQVVERSWYQNKIDLDFCPGLLAFKTFGRKLEQERSRKTS